MIAQTRIRWAFDDIAQDAKTAAFHIRTADDANAGVGPEYIMRWREQLQENTDVLDLWINEFLGVDIPSSVGV